MTENQQQDCGQMRQWLLLADSGELESRRQARLEAHLRGCADCRRCRDESRLLLAAAGRALTAAEPAAATLARIRRRARSRVSRPGAHILNWPRPLVLAAACAASLLLVLGGMLMLSRGTGEGSGLAGGPGAAANDEQLLDALVDEYMSAAPEAELDDDTERLAAQLLLIEALDREELIESGEIIQPLESGTTGLRSRNTPGSPPTGSV
jgi:hypothetical protein